MELSKGSILISIIIVSLCACLNAQTNEPSQFGAIACILDGSVLNVTIKVIRNNSNIIGAEFFDISDRSTRYSGGCNFVWDGAQKNFLTAELKIDVGTNNPPVGASSCGHNYIANTFPKEFRWAVHAFHEVDKETEGDSHIYFTCSASLTTEVIVKQYSVNITVDKNLTSNSGVIRMAVQFASNNQEANQVTIGNMIALKLEYQPSTFPQDGHTDTALRPWGVYCTELYATPDLQSTRKVYLQDGSGCPRTDHGFPSFASNFEHVTSITDKFVAITGGMQAARFDKTATDPIQITSGRVYFVCRARICWKKPNMMCSGRCQVNGRRKRQAPNEEEEEEERTLVTYIDIVDAADESPVSENGSGLPTVYMIGLSALGGATLLALVAVLLVCLYIRRRPPRDYYKHRNTASTLSSTTCNTKSSTIPQKQLRF